MPAAHAPETLQQHAAFVRAVARAVLGPNDLVDDAVQETWIVALERGHTRRGPLRPWLGGVARLKAMSLRRRRRRQERRERDAAHAGATASADELAARAELGRLVLDAVLALEEPYRSAILLRYHEGVAPPEIADRLDVPLETVRTRLRRGLAKLRETLARDAAGKDRSDWRQALLPLVLGPSGPRPPVAPSLPHVLLGGIAMKKTAALAVLAVLLLSGVVLLRPGERSGEDSGDGRRGGAALRDGEAGRREEPAAAHLAGRGGGLPTPAALVLPPPVDLEAVDRDRDLHGRVLADDGDALGGARVRIVLHPWRDSSLAVEPDRYAEAEHGAETRTAADGTFRLRLDPGEMVYLRIEAEGHAPVELARRLAGERVEIRMRRGVSLLVQVETVAGDPAEDVRIRLFPADKMSELSFDFWGTSDANGQVRIDDLVPGSRVGLRAFPRREAEGMPAVEDFTLPEAGEHVLRVSLADGWTLTGTVTDEETGVPVAGARVASQWDFSDAVETDALGHYALPGRAAGYHLGIHAQAAGYARRVLPAGGARSLDITLARGHELVGRVIDAGGATVAGALLRVVGTRPLKRYQDASLAAGRSDDEGRFRLDGLARDIPHALIVKALGHAKTIVDFDPPEGRGPVDLGDVRLAAPGRVVGRVLDSDGQPLPRTPVELKGWNADRSAHRAAGARPVSTYYGARESRQTDDLGRFAFTDVAPGRYVVSVPGGPEARASGQVEIEAGVVAPRIELRVSSERRVRILLKNEAREPIPGVHVVAYDRSRPVARATTGPEGVAELALPRRSVDAYVHPPADVDYESAGPIRLKGDADELEVVLEPALLLQGRLLGADGEPLHLAWISLWSEGEVIGQRVTDGNGQFSFRTPPGVRLSVAFDGRFQDAERYGRDYCRPLAARAEDVEAGARNVVMRAQSVPANRWIRVRLLDPSDRPIEGTHVGVWPRPRGGASAVTDAQGWALIENLPAVGLRIYVSWVPSSERPWVRPRAPELVPQGQEIVIRLSAGQTIEGTVVLEGAVDPAKVIVEARLPGNSARSAWDRLDDAGGFALVVDPEAGPYAVSAMWYDGRGQRIEDVRDEVPAGERGLVLRLERSAR